MHGSSAEASSYNLLIPSLYLYNYLEESFIADVTWNHFFINFYSESQLHADTAEEYFASVLTGLSLEAVKIWVPWFSQESDWRQKTTTTVPLMQEGRI